MNYCTLCRNTLFWKWTIACFAATLFKNEKPHTLRRSVIKNKKASCRNSSLKYIRKKYPQNQLARQKALWLCIRQQQQQQFIILISVLFLLILPTILSQKILHQTELFAMLTAFFLPVKYFIAFYWGFELEEKREYFFVSVSHSPFSFIFFSPRTKARSSSLFCPIPTIRP